MVFNIRDNLQVKHTMAKDYPICLSGCLLSARRDQEICLDGFFHYCFSLLSFLELLLLLFFSSSAALRRGKA